MTANRSGPPRRLRPARGFQPSGRFVRVHPRRLSSDHVRGLIRARGEICQTPDFRVAKVAAEALALGLSQLLETRRHD